MAEQIAAFVQAAPHAAPAPRLLLLLGAAGSGKSAACRAGLQRAGVADCCFAVDPAAVPDHKELAQQVDNYLHMGKPGAGAFRPAAATGPPLCGGRVLLLDDFEVLAAQDRMASGLVLRTLAKHRDVRVVVTCALSEERRLTELKKHTSLVLRMPSAAVVANDACRDEYIDDNIYGVVGALFRRPEDSLLALDKGVAVDPLLVSYLMYDNAPGFLPAAAMGPVRRTYCELAPVEEAAFAAGDWGLLDIVALVRCGAVRLQQRGAGRAGDPAAAAPHELTFSQVSARSAQRHCVLRRKAASQLEHGLSADNVLLLAAAAGAPRGRRRQRGGGGDEVEEEDATGGGGLAPVLRAMSSNLFLKAAAA